MIKNEKKPWTLLERVAVILPALFLLSLTLYAFSNKTSDVIFKIGYVEEIYQNDDPSDSLYFIVPVRTKWFEAYTLKSIHLRGNITIPLERGGIYHLVYKNHPTDQSMHVPLLIERIE